MAARIIAVGRHTRLSQPDAPESVLRQAGAAG
jgi:hypothetical protein